MRFRARLLTFALAASGCAAAEELAEDRFRTDGAPTLGGSAPRTDANRFDARASGDRGPTGGSAGAGGSLAGGSSGAAGVGGSAVEAGTDAPRDAPLDRPLAPPTMGFSVLYKVVGPSAMANAIQCELTIDDAGPSMVALRELIVRYYFTNEVVGQGVVDIGFAGVNPGFRDLMSVITKQVLPAPSPTFTADSYVEFGFNEGGPTIAPGQSVVIAWQYHGTNFPPLTQTNDYSFDATKQSPAPWDHVVLLRSGNVIWGVPP